MTAFSEILDKKWTTAGIPRVEAEHTPLSQLSKGQLTGHTQPSRKQGSTTYVTQTLFLDDGSFPFHTRNDAIRGTTLVKDTFASLGLEMHCGSNTNDKSKTEILWIPAPSFYSVSANEANRLTQTDNQNTNTTISNATNTDNTNPSLDTTDIFDDPITFVGTITTQRERHKRALTFSTMTPKQREELYWRSPTTNRINLNDDGEFIEFTAHFKYLGSYISFDLTDDMDIKNRITKANQAMGALRHVWRNPYADLKAKKLVFLAIPANLLLWGCETWALRQSHIGKLNVFWHRAIRNILGIRISEVIDDHITNEQIRKIFHDIPDAETILNARSTTYLGKVARSPDQHPPKLFMTAWVKNPRPKSGVLSTNKKAMVRSLNALLPEETTETFTMNCKRTNTTITKTRQNPNGKLSNWYHIALDKKLWEWHIYKLTHPNSPIPPKPSPTRPSANPASSDESNHNNSHHSNENRSDEQRHSNRRTNNNRNTNNQNQQDTPHPNSNHTNSNYNPDLVGRTRLDSIRALGLNDNASTLEIKHRFRRLSLTYHPDKYDPTLGISKDAATAHFQLLNNAYTYLREEH
jgi:hypothetical protein